MANWNDTDQRQGFGSVPRAGDAVARQETFDAGLRAHMLKIYNYMASGVLLHPAFPGAPEQSVSSRFSAG